MLPGNVCPVTHNYKTEMAQCGYYENYTRAKIICQLTISGQSHSEGSLNHRDAKDAEFRGGSLRASANSASLR